MQSLLGALREPAALLGGSGRLVAVNPSWSQVTIEGALAGPRFAAGDDFLGRCREVRGEPCEALAQGVAEVLGGRAPAFTHEHACGSADAVHHFTLEVSALGAGDGALVREADATERRRLEDVERRFRTLLEMLPEGYWDYDIATGDVYYSDRWLSALGYTRAEIKPVVESWVELLHPDDLPRVMEALNGYLEGRYPGYQCETRVKMKSGKYRWNIDRGRIIARDADGKPTRIMGMEIDISERREAERVIEEQSRRLMELSTPMIPISDEVVVMPLVGAIDAARAEQVLGALLHGLGRARANVAILDVTGVSLIDSQVASAIVHAARAVRLLGARAVLTGVRPDIASILVGLGIDLGDIVVRATLQSGIAYATGAERR